MTAISNVFSRECIAISSDSLLTEITIAGTVNFKEFKKSKIIPIPRIKGAMAYWGLAKASSLNTYEFLRNFATNNKSITDIYSFAEKLTEELRPKINSIKIKPEHFKGIGIHLVGFEKRYNLTVPELFLISNFTSPAYDKISDLSFSRRLYLTLPEDFKLDEHTEEDKCKTVINFLDAGGMFIFNNGDPNMFNASADSIFKLFRYASEKNLLRGPKDYDTFASLASRPIEIMKKAQRDFLKKEYIRVGGLIHNLVIDKNGKFYSTTGDAKI